MRPGVTAFVVFGTGEAILRRCLHSVKPAVEEIIAVDTGAADGARAVAIDAGARVLTWSGRITSPRRTISRSRGLGRNGRSGWIRTNGC